MLSNIEAEGYYSHNGLSLARSDFNIKWFSEFGIEPKLIVDIGSYDCGDSIRFSLAFPEAMIHSFEGCPERNRIISGYIDNYPNIIHNPVAMSDITGYIDWYSAKHGNSFGAQGSLFKHTDVYKQTYGFIKQEEQPVQVETETFNFVFGSARVDLAHIDVEGAEINVVKGFKNSRPTLVYVETLLDGQGWYGGTNPQELHDLLLSMGYIKIISNGINTLYQFTGQNICPHSDGTDL